MKQKVNKPLMHGVAKVPVIMQLEMLECGAASLCMVMGYFGKWITLEQARVDCGVSRDGSNMKNIMKAAKSYGMEVHAYRLEAEALLEEGPYPCIIHWGFNHFVVLDGFKDKKAVLNDPARGRVVVPWEEFDREFTGICMTIEPGEGFEPSGNRKSALDYAKERLKGTGIAIAFAVTTKIITSLMGILNPVFSRIFLDRLLTARNPNWFLPFMILFSLFTFITILVSWIGVFYNTRIQGKLAAVGNSSYLWKVLRLPMQFFEQRLAGDIADRQSGNASIANSLVNITGPLALDTVMMIFYLVIMIRYNLLLTFVGVAAIFINMFVSFYISQKRINITRVSMRDQAKLSGTTISGISMIETIKSSGAEKGFFAKWAGYQASVNEAEIRYTNLNQYLGVIPGLVNSIANLSVLGIGVFLVLQGKFSIGMVMAFQGFLGSFTSPAASLISAGQSVQEMVTQMERVDDVMNYPSDPCFEEKEKPESYAKLSGNIEISNVTFGYSRLNEPLIKDFSLSVKTGQRIAFVGQSGCGKSTMAKLLTGLYQPWSGSIKYDGKEITAIDRNIFTGSVSVVDQDITLFEDTIAENIRMWDTSIEDFEVILAARDAGIHDDIIKKDGGYQHKLLEGGKDLSGGQKQRIEIARALAQDPTICILDEATSALDAKTEYEVVNAISNRGITCIIIAHRLSTIRDCDEIIVLDHGNVVERGTHDELYALDGFYKRLVINE